jgi:hypothetical protein
VGLAAMMNLMLEQMKQQPVHSLALDAVAAVDLDHAIEAGSAEALHDSDQSPVDLALRDSQQDRGVARLRVGPGRRSKRAALHRVDVKAIDNQDVIEGRAQAWKETAPRRHEISLRQKQTGREQTMVGPAVVVGHRPVGKHSFHRHLQYPNRSSRVAAESIMFGAGRPKTA